MQKLAKLKIEFKLYILFWKSVPNILGHFYNIHSGAIQASSVLNFCKASRNESCSFAPVSGDLTTLISFFGLPFEKAFLLIPCPIPKSFIQ